MARFTTVGGFPTASILHLCGDRLDVLYVESSAKAKRDSRAQKRLWLVEKMYGWLYDSENAVHKHGHCIDEVFP